MDLSGEASVSKMDRSLYRKASFGTLFFCLLVQAALTYFDPVAAKHPRLSPDAKEGKKIYQKHNCQACHQIFGFGGFLGPDLTNRVNRIPPEALQKILHAGNGAMPVFLLNEIETKNLHTYFEEINALGGSIAKTKSQKLVFSEIPWFDFFAEGQQ